MSYRRVIPCDMLNEAKLLKCLGIMSIKIHDGIDPVSNMLTQTLEKGTKGFIIEQGALGELSCVNYRVFDNSGVPVHLSTLLNSRLNYPLMFEYGDTHGFVFDDSGRFTEGFIRRLNESSI